MRKLFLIAAVVLAGRPLGAQQPPPPAQPSSVPQAPAPQPVPPPATPVLAQPTAPRPGARVLTLDDVFALAEGKSEQVAIATAGVARAVGIEQQTRSQKFPQVFGSTSYDRTLASEFEGLFDDVGGGGETGGEDGGVADLPFGRSNIFRINLGVEQVLYTGGRISAQERQARLGRDAADLNVTATRAQFIFDVTQAFYEAALSDRLVFIAEQLFQQADSAYQQIRAQREAGRQSEFELLRSQVSRDTLQPDIVRARSNRDIAYLRLKQLVDLPLDADIQLAVELEGDVLPTSSRLAPLLAEAEAAVTARDRNDVLQLQKALQVSEEDVTVARSQRFPNVSLNTAYGPVNYPGTFSDVFEDWRTNWTVGAAVSLPIFTGGRIKAEEAIARAGVEESRQRLQLTRELALLDAESARQELTAARAEWDSSAGTIQQATRAYEIAELRYREGLSTQLELSDARLLLAQARLNRAQAARTLQVARARFALLPDLPLVTSSGAAAQPLAQEAFTQSQVDAARNQRTVPTGTATGGGTTAIGGRQ